MTTSVDAGSRVVVITNGVSNLNHSSNHDTSPNELSEEAVANWLDSNKGWFQLYAIENLEANTVEKWLRSNGKRVCKCKNPSVETMMSSTSLLAESGSHSLSAVTAAARGKRNSIAGLIPIIDDINGQDHMSASFGESLIFNELRRKNRTSPNLQDNSVSSTQQTNGGIMEEPGDSETQEENRRGSIVVHQAKKANNEMKNCNSSSSCLIHNRKSWYLVSAEDKQDVVPQAGKKFSFVYEETKSDNENEDSNSSVGSAKSIDQDAAKSPTICEDGTNSLKTSPPQNIIWTAGPAAKKTVLSGNGGGGGSGNPIRKFHSFHTGTSSSEHHHHHNHHHHHSHYHHQLHHQQSSSLNALKFLIKSKVKLPQAFTNSSNHISSTATITPSGDNKIRIRYNEGNNSNSNSNNKRLATLATSIHPTHHLDVKLLLECIKDIAYELDLKRLSDKIVANVKALVNADNASIFFVCHNRQQLAAFKYDAHTGIRNSATYLARSQMNANQSAQQPQQQSPLDFEFEIPFENTILGSVAISGNPVNISNVSKDVRYDSSMDKLTGYHVKSLLCMPIKNANKEVVAVVQAINKSDPYHAHRDSSSYSSSSSKIGYFNDNDVRILNDYLQFCAISISNSQLFDFYIYECERNRSLIEVLHDLFEQQTNLDTILFRIMQRAQTLLKCQRCSILLDLKSAGEESDTMASARKAFDLFQSGNRPGQRRHSVEDDDGSKISRELADYVIQTGEKINLADAYSDPRFDPLVDTVWRFKTKGILCMPIRNRDGAIIGCANIANRLDGQPFDEADEELFEAFCIFCGLGINNTLIYNKLEKSMAEKVVALEVLSYHATCSKGELAAFLAKYSADIDPDSPDESVHSATRNNGSSLAIVSASNSRFPKSPSSSSVASSSELIARLSTNVDSCLTSYLFNDFSLENDEMIVASYEMFKRSGLMKSFHIDKQTLFQWLLTVKKNYRNVEYHNWRHAFNVGQNMFAIIDNSAVSSHLQDIEKLALLVGCLCHDLDHRGTNNMFQVESHSALCQLYGTTGVLEKHHFNHCVMILNTAGHNIFSNIKPRTYGLLMSYIKEAILATDLAEHFMIMSSFQEAVDNKDVYWNEEPYCSLLRKNLMTFCDLAAVAKPWPIHKRVVNLVTKEFFAQGDRERLELNKEPNEMMDARRYRELPRLQIAWIDNVCLPLYSSFTNLCSSFNGHLQRINENRVNWANLYEKVKNSDTPICLDDEVD